MLRDRDWRFRRSGLFGRDDHQAGGISVALTLQQREANLRGTIIAWATSMNLDPAGAEIERCETDFVLLIKNHAGELEILIGECKSSGEVSEADVKHLAKVANAFEGSSIRPFVVFSKLSDFTGSEVKRFQAAQAENRLRTILLSKDELEPYHIYERLRRSHAMALRGGTAEELASATQRIYLNT